MAAAMTDIGGAPDTETPHKADASADSAAPGCSRSIRGSPLRIVGRTCPQVNTSQLKRKERGHADL